MKAFRGPCYSTKASRSGARIGDIFDKNLLDNKLRTLHRAFQQRYGKDLLKDYDVEEEIARFDKYREELADFVVDQVPLVSSAQESNQAILVEGANALLLDIDAGTYPMVTSSNTGLGGCFTGLAISPFKIKDILGVVKAYTTRVGSGESLVPTHLHTCMLTYYRTLSYGAVRQRHWPYSTKSRRGSGGHVWACSAMRLVSFFKHEAHVQFTLTWLGMMSGSTLY